MLRDWSDRDPGKRLTWQEKVIVALVSVAGIVAVAALLA